MAQNVFNQFQLNDDPHNQRKTFLTQSLYLSVISVLLPAGKYFYSPL